MWIREIHVNYFRIFNTAGKDALSWTSLVAQRLESAYHAGHMGLIPGLGRFHMPQGNGTITQPTRLEPSALQQEKKPRWEAHAP